jgi:hypothetical protein
VCKGTRILPISQEFVTISFICVANLYFRIVKKCNYYLFLLSLQAKSNKTYHSYEKTFSNSPDASGRNIGKSTESLSPTLGASA